jgi:hypothetical protein
VERTPHRAVAYKSFVYGLIFPPQAPSPVMKFLFISADCLVISFFLYLLVNLRERRRHRGQFYPLGPPTWPIIGNLLNVPKETPWSAYADMSKKYGGRIILVGTSSTHLIPAVQGDIICLRIFSQVVVVLCSSSAIKDLLERRGQTYSDRPLMPITKMYVL